MTHAEWAVRKAAAEAIKALAIALGPGLDSPGPAALPADAGAMSASIRAAEALEKCRFDKVKPVREAVQEAQAVLLDLQVRPISLVHCTLMQQLCNSYATMFLLTFMMLHMIHNVTCMLQQHHEPPYWHASIAW